MSCHTCQHDIFRLDTRQPRITSQHVQHQCNLFGGTSVEAQFAQESCWKQYLFFNKNYHSVKLNRNTLLCQYQWSNNANMWKSLLIYVLAGSLVSGRGIPSTIQESQQLLSYCCFHHPLAHPIPTPANWTRNFSTWLIDRRWPHLRPKVNTIHP
jgi:hypothetical protein